MNRRTNLIIFSTILALLLAVPLVGLALSTPDAAAAANCTNSLADSTFEIDPNANLKVDNPADCIDWLEPGGVVNGVGPELRAGVLTKVDKPSGANDDSFGQGTSENDANPTIVDGSIPPNKSDLKRFGIYTETTANAKFLELFWTRVQNPSGTTNMDFELNQKFCDPSATPTNCANNKHQPPETPLRTTGDKLITYDLSKGGTVPTISIRTWNGTSWGAATVISGGQNANALGSVNSTTIARLLTGGVNGNLGNQDSWVALDPFTFGEAAINFNAIFQPGGPCGKFGSVYLKSRSSDSFSAELKDFIGPRQVNITNCTTLTTSATQSTTIGGKISDTATLSGGTSPTGTVTFHLFPSLADCQNGTNEINTGLSPVTVNGNGNYNSGDFTPTTTGTYYWTATYSGDGSNAGSTTACDDANEQSTVNKAKPSISTTLSADSITVGGSVHDSATLSGATSDAGGTVTYTVYTNNTCTAGARDAGTKTVTNGVVPDSNSLQFNSAGTFYWQASYSGDANNEAAKSDCTSETLVVGKAKPSISTTLSADSITVGGSVHDSATLSGATSDAGGTVTYTVYTNNTCTAGARDAGTKTVTNGVVPDSNTLVFNTPGDFYWQASYSGDANNEAAKSDCTSEHLVVGKAPANLATAQKLVPQDSATLTANAGGTPTGTVDFVLYSGADCSGTPVYQELNVPLTNGTANTNNTTFFVNQASSGDYKWIVTYSGDSTHNGATSACGKEAFTATIDNDTTN